MSLIDYTPAFADIFGDKGQHEAAIAWFTAHGVEANLVPLDTPLELDAETNEWRFQVYRHDASGHKSIETETGEPARVTVRRAFKSLPPWATPAAEPVGASA